MLEDLVGPTTLKLGYPAPLDIGTGPLPQARAAATAQLESRAKNASAEVTVLLKVESIMDGSGLPEEMPYSLSLHYTHKSGGGQTSSEFPVTKSGIQRPMIDIEAFRKKIQELARI